MLDRSVRHRGFARRLLALLGVSSLAAVAGSSTACGGKVLVADAVGAGGSGGGATTGGEGGEGGEGGTFACDAGSWQQTTLACFPIQIGGCPAIDAPGIAPLLAAQLGLCDAVTDFFDCCDKASVVGVACGPDPGAAAECCYQAWIDPQMSCASGRPFFVDGVARTAKALSRADWLVTTLPALDALALDPATRAALAASWTREAGFEHASVASFARLALELLSVGAPAALVRDAQQAMGDEIHHAELCFALASAYAGAPVGPGPMAMDGALVRTSLATVAAAAVREGCIGETVAALVAEEARDLAEDPAVREALSVIAADEAEHAAMAWRLVAWAQREGDAAVREAIATAFAAPVSVTDELSPPGMDTRLYRAHGRPLPEDVRAIAATAMREVIAPGAEALMAITPSSSTGRKALDIASPLRAAGQG